MTDPPLAVDTEHGRWYINPQTGEHVPSVTNITGIVAKPKLVGWAARMAAEYADRNWLILSALEPSERIGLIRDAHNGARESAADMGTIIHAVIDAWCQGTEPLIVPDVARHQIAHFREFLDVMQPQFIETETTVWNGTVGYAGTLDALAWVDGVLWLWDWKTGRRAYPEAGMQLAALANGERIMRSDGSTERLPEVERMAVVQLRPRSWTLYELSASSRRSCWEAFKAAAVLSKWHRESDGTTYMSPLRCKPEPIADPWDGDTGQWGESCPTL